MKKGKPWLKKKAVEAVKSVVPQKIGKFGTKQIVKTIEKAVTGATKKKPRTTVPMKQLAPAEPLPTEEEEVPAEVPQEAVGRPKFLLPPPKRAAPPKLDRRKLIGGDWRKTYGPVLQRRKKARMSTKTRRAPRIRTCKRGCSEPY